MCVVCNDCHGFFSLKQNKQKIHILILKVEGQRPNFRIKVILQRSVALGFPKCGAAAAVLQYMLIYSLVKSNCNNVTKYRLWQK